MKIKILFLFIMCLAVSTFAQKKKEKEPQKCKLVYDKELGMEVYKNLEYAPMPFEGANDSLLIYYTYTFDSTKYNANQRINFAYQVGIDGKHSLLKLIDPKEDKLLEKEVRIYLSLFAISKPGTCDGKPVPVVGYMTMPLKSKIKTVSK